jgi:hypothetical protein
VYAWIWRHIPFRKPQYKALVSLVLIGAIGALLWYKIFPAVEPLLPFDDGQIENSNGTPADGSQGGTPVPSQSSSPGPSAIPTIITPTGAGLPS